jgi:type I restriction enzyme M protein
MVRVAMTDMRLHGDGHSNIRCTDALLPFDTYSDLHRETFDIVATNPPFGVDLPQEALSDLGRFDVVASQRQGATISLEVLAVNRCLDLLRPGGRMAIVLPDGILSNRNTTYVREWIEKQAKIRAIVSLPVETFTPFGANIKTSVIFLRKLNPGEEPADYKVFLAEVRSVGHDASGRPIECDDFDELADQFSHFIKLEEW